MIRQSIALSVAAAFTLTLSSAATAPPAAGALPRGCTGSASLGTFRISVRPPGGGTPLPIKAVSLIPPGSQLLWDPIHLSARLSQKGEVTAVVAPEDGNLTALELHKAGEHVEWKLPSGPAVVALVLGPQGLSMGKVKSLVARNEDLLRQLADYAEQTSEVEALVQQLADSEDSGRNADAALKGFSSQYGIAVPKLDTKASTDQQAAVLLQALLPSANTYDPLAPAGAQMQQSVGLAASVAGMFFGSGVGLAAGGTALVADLKTVLFPNMEFRTAFAQADSNGGMALCTRNAAAKSRTRIAYLWAYRVPNLKPPVAAISGPAHVASGSISPLKVAFGGGAGIKELERARAWRLVPDVGGAAIPVKVTFPGAADAVELDLAKARPVPGDYRLAASWDWDSVSLGPVHVHPYGDLSAARIANGYADRLVQGHGIVTVGLTGADFEFVQKVELRKLAVRAPAPTPVHFDLPRGHGAGEQRSIDLQIDTASSGAYHLVLDQADGKSHEIPLAVLPPNPRIANLPIRVNLGEPDEPVRLEGAGLERIDSVSTAAGEIKGAVQGDAWVGRIHPKTNLKLGDHFPLVLEVQALETPLTIPDAIEVVGPRPKITAVRRALPGNLGVELREDELPAGTTIGFVLSVSVRDEARPRLDLGCQSGGLRHAIQLSPDDPVHGASLTFSGPGELYLAFDAGVAGYAGCSLTATLRTDPEGASDPLPLGRVVRLPKLQQFTLTSEQIGPATYGGILNGSDLDLVERTGWDSEHGLPVEAIPTPAPGDPARQTLRIALPWPAPSPHASLFIWLRGERQGRRTAMTD